MTGKGGVKFDGQAVEDGEPQRWTEAYVDLTPTVPDDALALSNLQVALSVPGCRIAIWPSPTHEGAMRISIITGVCTPPLKEALGSG